MVKEICGFNKYMANTKMEIWRVLQEKISIVRAMFIGTEQVILMVSSFGSTRKVLYVKRFIITMERLVHGKGMI